MVAPLRHDSDIVAPLRYDRDIELRHDR